MENPGIRQGFLEGSNVNAVEEMSRMMMSVRAFETYQKIIQTIDNADERSVIFIGRVVQPEMPPQADGQEIWG